ncbi:MAG TPA: carbonic anhydrase family protein [Puia sp.]|jgi:carbonic anhydrase|nr:carbonic anhydrase family protein [Puia sp.]
MKPLNQHLAKALSLLLLLSACHNATDDQPDRSPKAVMPAATAAPMRTSVLTATDQQALSPDKVIADLKNGNRNYQSNHPTPMNDTAMMRATAKTQYPEAFILSCMDSRVPVEKIFDKGIGDLFVGRVAGNIIDEDVLGSMEYGCKLAGARLIVVLGHESCGAVKAAIEGEQLGNVTGLLAHIQPAIQLSHSTQGAHDNGNPMFVTAVIRQNVRNSIRDIKAESPVLKELAEKGEIRIVGAYYSLHTGEVTFFDDDHR